MSVEFLGTGTSTGIPLIGCHCPVCKSTDIRDTRLRASVLINCESEKILIDAGPDLRCQLLRAKVSHLTAILLTHEHYDHVGGLDDVRPLGEVPVFAESRVLHMIRKNMPYCFKENPYPGVPQIKLNDVNENAFMIANVKVQPIRVFHAKLPVLGYRIGNVAYITDLKTISKESVEQLRGLDVLILNALRIHEHISHISLSEAIALAKEINAHRTYFTHFSHDLGLHAEVQKSLPENMFLSWDGLVVDV
ncbi:MAG: MBL fold metallo-hydrolase [Paludibacteraceae bacterium]|nr:MBL fold metallo-hydrolase [Paludibacteraceae bacterium]